MKKKKKLMKKEPGMKEWNVSSGWRDEEGGIYLQLITEVEVTLHTVCD